MSGVELQQNEGGNLLLKARDYVCEACGEPAFARDIEGTWLCHGDYAHLLEHQWIEGFRAETRAHLAAIGARDGDRTARGVMARVVGEAAKGGRDGV